MTTRYWLNVRDKPTLLRVVMKELAGDARISFEGDLSTCKGLLGLPGASVDATETLKRNTMHPVRDFVILPLEEATIAPILRELGSGRPLVRDIEHIQIEKHGQLQFGSYDSFHPDGCVVWWGVAESVLGELQAKGILRSYEPAPDRGVDV